MAIPNRTVIWVPSSDGSCSGLYPAGDKPPAPATLAWGSVAALQALIANLPATGSFSHNVRQYLTGTAAATAPIIVETVSGDDAATKGWAVSGDDNLTQTATAGSGFLRLGATDSGFTRYTGNLSWLRQAAPSDSYAPNTPFEVIGTPGTNQIVWSFDSSSDPPNVSTPGSGVKEYDLELNGAAPLVRPATSPGVSLPLTLANIGASTPTPTDVLTSGNAGTMTGGGTGFQGTADQGPFWYAQLSGDFDISIQVDSFTSPTQQFAPCGLMVRESLAAGSKNLSCYVQRFSHSAQVKARDATDAVAHNVASSAANSVTGVYTVRIQRRGNVFTCVYSLDRNTTVPITQYTLDLPTTVYVGKFLSSRVDGSSLSATYSNFCLTTVARQAYTQSTTTANRQLRVRARDVAGNVSAYSPIVTASPIVASVPLRSWNPGVGVLGSGIGTWSLTTMSQARDAGAKWWSQIFYWKHFEVARGVYDFTLARQWFSDVTSRGMRGILQTWNGSFNSGPYTNSLPAYLSTELSGGPGYYASTDGGYAAKIYAAPIMDRYLLMWQAIAQEFDGEAKFEGIRNGESSLHAGYLGQSDYSSDGYLTQYKRLIAAAPTYFTRSIAWVALNFGFPREKFPEILAHMYANKCGITDPDVYTSNVDHSTNGSRCCRGLVYNPSNTASNPDLRWEATGIDYRGLIPVGHECQGPEMGGKEGNPSLNTLYAHALTVNKDNHMPISVKQSKYNPVWPAPDDIYWDNNASPATTDPDKHPTDTRTWLALGGHPLIPTAPSCYGGNVITGA